MSEVLSQSQIDALLKSVQNGEADQSGFSEPVHKERKYDFLTPKKFTKENLKLLDSIYINYARMIESRFSSVLRLNCEVEMIDIEEQKYAEFNNALNDTDVLSVVDFHLGNGDFDSDPIMIHISKSILYIFIDRLMGGPGDPGEEDDSPFTEIELSLFDNINSHIVPLMNESWKSHFDARLSYSKVEETPRLSQEIASDDIVVIVVLNVVLRDVNGKINICLPGGTLERMFKAFNERATGRQRDHKGESASEAILSNISGSLLDISVKLGEAEFRLADLVQMRVGDIVNLNKPQNSDVVLCVEDTPWFHGELGVQKQNIAVKINGPVTDE